MSARPQREQSSEPNARLLLVSPERPEAARGGLGVAVGAFRAAFERAGVATTLVTPDGPDPPAWGVRRPDREPALDPYALPSPALREAGRSAFARRVLAAAEIVRPAAVHAHDWLALDAARTVQDELGLPLVAHVHSTEWDRRLGRVDPFVLDVEGRGLRAADRVLCVSGRTRDQVVRRHGVAPERTAVVHPPLDDLQPAAGPARRSSAPLVLFIGRLVPQKGVDLFLRTAQRLRAEIPRARFVVAGDGPGFADAVERSLQLGLGARVRFTGQVSRAGVEDLLARADALLVPSLAEPYGLVGLEAARAGVPVVASRACGFLEVLPAFAAFDPLDAAAAAQGLCRALQRPEDVRQWRARADRALARRSGDVDAARALALLLPRAAPLP